MHRCYASPSTARSLDLILRDFASINLRQHRARNFFLHHRTRRLFSAGATEPLRWHVEANELGDKRWRDAGSGLNITGYEKPQAQAMGEALPLEEGDGKWREDDDWHADVAVNQVAATAAGAVPRGAVTGSGLGPEIAGEEEPLEESLASSAQAPSGAPGSRAASRLARRQRREQAGNVMPRESARKPEGELEAAGEDYCHDGVLRMIEKMDGPAIAKRKAKTAKMKRREEERKAQGEEGGVLSSRLRKLAQGKDGKEKKDASRPALKPKRDRERWQIDKEAMLNKLGEATWQPRKRLSPDTMEGIRALHASDPATYSTATLSSQFEVSAESIRRILKSKWQPSDEEREERSKRWERRGVRKWTEMAEMGERPPRRWRELGVGSVKGEPKMKPAWKRGGGEGGRRRENAQDGDGDDGWINEQEFGERIL